MDDATSGAAEWTLLDWTKPPALARLVTESFTIDLQHLPVVLGRRPKHTPSTIDPNLSFISLGDIKTVSREHALIDWSADRTSFTIVSKSKNGINVDGREYPGAGTTVELGARSKIVMGNCPLFFLLPARYVDDDVSTDGADASDGSETELSSDDHSDRPPSAADPNANL